MSFLYPSFFYGLLFLVIPIIIHFFNFQRPKRVYFTNIGFLKQIKSDTNAKNRLKHLLVLLARLAFITALVLAFAQPIFSSKIRPNTHSKSAYVSIYIDNSWSMTNTINDITLLDKAYEYLESLSKAFDYGIKFQRLDNETGQSIQGFYDREDLDFNKHYSSLGLSATDVQHQQIEAFKRQSSPSDNSIFWLSDFQKTTFNLDEVKIDKTQKYYLLPFIGNVKDNLYIDSVWLNKPFIRSKENAVCYVQLHNLSQTAFNNVVIKLLIEAKEVSNQIINLKPNTKERVELNFVFNKPGSKRCTIIIEDYALDFDNRYYFILPSIESIKIAHLSHSSQDFIKNVYSEEQFFQYVALNYNTLDYNSLKDFDLIIMENISDINPTLANEIHVLNQKGLDLVIFPHPESNLESYKQLLVQDIEQVSTATKTALAPPQLESSIFKDVLLKVQPDMTMPKAQPVWTWQGLHDNILNYKDGKPFLSLLNYNSSKVYLFATPLDFNFTDLPYHAIFVPIMYKIALKSIEAITPLAHRMDDKLISLKLKGAKKNLILALQHTDQRIIPPQSLIDNQIIFDPPSATLEAGFYDLIDNANDSLLGYIAFNYAKAESILNETESTLKAFADQHDNVAILDVNDKDTFLASLEESQGHLALWAYCLALALVFLLLEILLIRFR